MNTQILVLVLQLINDIKNLTKSKEEEMKRNNEYLKVSTYIN